MTKTLDEVISTASSHAVQVADVVFQRFSQNLIGGSVSTRLTDVYIYNKTDYKFRLVSSSSGSGGFLQGPTFEIQPHQMVHHQVSSHGFMTGCTDCIVYYQPEGISSGKIWMSTSNPYVGSNHAEAGGGSYFDIVVNSSVGDNNYAEFFITAK